MCNGLFEDDLVKDVNESYCLSRKARERMSEGDLSSASGKNPSLAHNIEVREEVVRTEH